MYITHYQSIMNNFHFLTPYPNSEGGSKAFQDNTATFKRRAGLHLQPQNVSCFWNRTCGVVAWHGAGPLLGSFWDQQLCITVIQSLLEPPWKPLQIETRKIKMCIAGC